ncbi:MAG: cytochrome C oxidase subunit IV family protein [Anaerolineales bacterium]|jgi:cytochrome c oxidase subunit 4
MNEPSHSSIRTYLFVYVGLLLLLGSTVGAAYLPLGPFHLVAAVGIAIAKAILVALFFMGLRESKARTQLLFLTGLFILAFLIGLMLTDYLTRVNGLPFMP